MISLNLIHRSHPLRERGEHSRRGLALAEFDAAAIKDQKLPTVSDRPTASVVRTIGE
jgi:hypothetical protein